MKLTKNAIAGTLESSDAQIMVAPGNHGREIELNSTVKKQYGKQILKTIHEVLDNLEVEDVVLSIQDQGALDCTIRARVETALLRATDYSEELPWGTKL